MKLSPQASVETIALMERFDELLALVLGATL
jgi:hypothetical protein